MGKAGKCPYFCLTVGRKFTLLREGEPAKETEGRMREGQAGPVRTLPASQNEQKSESSLGKTYPGRKGRPKPSSTGKKALGSPGKKQIRKGVGPTSFLKTETRRKN